MSRELNKYYDTPLSEHDCQVFLEFYQGFLGQSKDNSLNLLKALSLMRQSRRRLIIHNIMSSRRLAEQVFLKLQEQEKLLIFPSILENIWQQVLEYKSNYAGSFDIQPLQEMVVNYLGQIENNSNLLKVELKKVQSIQPKDKFSLSIAFAGTGELKQQQRPQYQWLLISLVDRSFLCVLPGDAKDSTMALGKLRTYVNQVLGANSNNFYLEFFTIGGGFLIKKNQVELFGRNPLFDISFASPNTTHSYKLMALHNNAKFNLAYEILSAEFPVEGFFWETME
ncbi:MAG: hypothetical protein WAQ98_31110 [Blastocatellia bacterium]